MPKRPREKKTQAEACGHRLARPAEDGDDGMSRAQASRARALVIGIGNPGRGDDGLGPKLVEHLESAGLEGVDLDSNYQLNVEDALACSRHEAVIFVDAGESGDVPFTFTGLEPGREIAFTTHELSPASVLALCEELYGRRPEAWVLAVRGYEWDLVEGLSPRAEINLSAALAFLLGRIK
jgi:hydrogenase maturation protease